MILPANQMEPCDVDDFRSLPRHAAAMSKAEIPEPIQRFILQYIDSVAMLEALLLMRREPQQIWNSETLAERLYISNTQTQLILKTLTQSGFCQLVSARQDEYLYAPASSQLQALIEQLAVIYTQQLISVTHLIHQRQAAQNPRSLKLFLDAFRLNKEV